MPWTIEVTEEQIRHEHNKYSGPLGEPAFRLDTPPAGVDISDLKWEQYEMEDGTPVGYMPGAFDAIGFTPEVEEVVESDTWRWQAHMELPSSVQTFSGTAATHDDAVQASQQFMVDSISAAKMALMAEVPEGPNTVIVHDDQGVPVPDVVQNDHSEANMLQKIMFILSNYNIADVADDQLEPAIQQIQAVAGPLLQNPQFTDEYYEALKMVHGVIIQLRAEIERRPKRNKEIESLVAGILDG